MGQDTSSRYLILKMYIGVMGTVLFVLSLLVSPQWNVWNGIGIVLVVFTLVYTLHNELDYVNRPVSTGTAQAHPLILCLWANIHIFFPAYTVYLAIVNNVRDYIAVTCYGVIGMMLAFSMQRLFWSYWNIHEDIRPIYSFFLSLCGVVLSVLLFMMTCIYHSGDSPYMSTIGIEALVLVLVIVFFFAETSIHVPSKRVHEPFHWVEAGYLLLLCACNLIITVLSILDSYLV